jgi:hypothetical protein
VTGQETGQGPPGGFTWGDYLQALVEHHGTLTALAWRLVQAGNFADDVGSVERGLRRLRARGQKDGGEWGRRLLRLCGVPRSVAARTQWMGVYHSRFTDLPLSLCVDQLRLWDRPPVSESWARIWLRLGLANAALRQGNLAQANQELAQARGLAAHAPVAAQVELLLVEAFAASAVDDRATVEARLAEVGARLASPELDADDAACFRARWLDQRAWQLNHPSQPRAPDPARARALYEQLPDGGLPPFAGCRRENGLAYALWKLGHTDEALRHSEAACRYAGDGGYLRLRAMTLHLRARILGGEAGAEVRRRARAIAEQLEDRALLARLDRK